MKKVLGRGGVLIQEGSLFWPKGWGLLKWGYLFNEIRYMIQCNNCSYWYVTINSLFNIFFYIRMHHAKHSYIIVQYANF